MRYTGKNLYIGFTVGDTTHLLHSDYRALTVSTEVELDDKSAGAETHKSYIPTLAETSIKLEFLDNTDNTSLFWTNLTPSVEGVLVWGPLGNSAGKPKYSAECVVSSVEIKYPYAEVVEVTVEFQAQSWIVRETWS